MKLKKMEIVGFKSFCDKATIQFPSGISAIVGPNGCGKSNIVDALRWAMGEQSVKQLRGKSMEDIIFAGTNGRSALNMAEVTLTMVNENGTGPEELKDFTEISMTRRLYRSGESYYMINKQPCRLKDIHNIFLGSGMSAKSYAIIQQGNIGAITDAGPEERRIFIEEAAGTTRYKERKKETLRKLDATNQNLLRVTDIITEVERQMNSMKRQAQKAERFKDCQRRTRELDIRLSVRRFDQLSQAIKKDAYRLKALRDRDLGHAAALKRLEAEAEDIKLRRARKNEDISARKSEKFELQREIDRNENEREHLKKERSEQGAEITELGNARETLGEKNLRLGEEIVEATEMIETLNREIAALQETLAVEQRDSQAVRERQRALQAELEARKNALMDLVSREARCKNVQENAATQLENIDRRLKRMDEDAALAGQKLAELRKSRATAEEEQVLCLQEIEEIDGQLAEMRENFVQKRGERDEAAAAVRSIDYERNQAASRHDALRKMAESYEWYRDGVQSVMKNDALAGRIKGLMADILEPAPDYETAVEAVLGDALQYILVADAEAGEAGIAFLREAGKGRGGFVPVAASCESFNFRTPRKEIRETGGSQSAGDADMLLNHVTVPEAYRNIADIFLKDVVVTESLDEAMARFNANGSHRTFVTKDGNLVSSSGVLVGGSPDTLAGILAKKQEIKALAERISALDKRFTEAESRYKSLDEAVRSLETDIERQAESKAEAEHDRTEAEKQLIRVSEELKHAERSLETLRMERERLTEASEAAEAEIEQYGEASAKVTAEVRAAREKVAESEAALSELATNVGEADERVTELRVKLTAMNAELENGNRNLKRLRDFKTDGENRLETLADDIEAKREKLAAAEAGIAKCGARLAALYETLTELDALLSQEEDEYTAIDDTLRENESAASKIKDEREEVVRNIRMIEIEQSQRQMKRENIDGRVQERYHGPIASFRGALDAMEGADLSDDALSETIADLRKKIAGMGNVNLGAIKEYEELKERFEFLDEQRADLTKATEDLHKVIRKINKISQERFLETFEQINAKLGEVFPRLFNGGFAKLVLTEPDNPLDSGVELMVHPPGKKLTRLTLLSGGEKALSAIAFIFSIFLIKPASFCILDEIDAPLDEANVYRFNELLKIIGEQSQIIMITHKKKSMEFADILFGVTMEQKGVSKVVSVNFEQAEKQVEEEEVEPA